MIRRRSVAALACLMAVLLGRSPPAPAQPAQAPPLIGVLSLEHGDGRHPEVEAFLAGLLALGWRDGESLAIAYRWAGYDEEKLPAMAAELAALRVRLLVALAPPAVQAARAAAPGIPIVMRTTVDPIAAGFTTSMAHPDRNVTGLSSTSGALYAKRLELLQELLPGLGRLAVLHNPDSRTGADYLAGLRAAADSRAVALLELGARRPEDLPTAFLAATREGAQALIPLRDPLIVRERQAIARLAVESRLPAIYDDREFVEAGGLVSYGANLAAMHQRAAYFVDRLLKGAKPAELPIEEPTRFELVLNRRAARAIGLEFAPTILARADEVIE